jgi:formate hydrogenlyase subunit 3/multisubunit Na+/H+ antiporter MnhD subunit
MLMIAQFFAGFAAILGSLFLIGITRGNRVSQKTWVILWTMGSIGLVLFLVISVVLYDETLLNYALGGSVGYVTAVSIHTLDHAIEEIRKSQD